MGCEVGSRFTLWLCVGSPECGMVHYRVFGIRRLVGSVGVCGCGVGV